MRALVTVYEFKGCFLMYPSGPRGRGPWLAQEPGLGASANAPDEVIGQLVLLASRFSTPVPLDTPMDKDLCFPLLSLAGLKTWSGLARASGMLLSVEFDGEKLKISRSTREGAGYTFDQSFTPLKLAPDVSPQELGSHVRASLLGEA